jgi:hypothetical protein
VEKKEQLKGRIKRHSFFPFLNESLKSTVTLYTQNFQIIKAIQMNHGITPLDSTVKMQKLQS